jgi:Protein of unknown function (DUF1176)
MCGLAAASEAPGKDMIRTALAAASVFAFLSALIAYPALGQTAAQPDVDLKLFEKPEVDRSKGCSVVLWQANRDPETDKFAYIFHETLAPRTHARQPARIKIGGNVLTMTRVALGGKTNGYALHEYQLYKLPGPDEFVILQLKIGELEGETIDVDEGTMSVIMKGRQVFRAAVKGNAGCNTPAAAPPPPARPAAAPAAAAPAVGPGMFERYTVRPEQVPRVMTQAMAKQFGCEAATMRRPVIGYQMSEESAIWQVSCANYGDRMSAVFALVYLTDPAKQFTFIPFRWKPGQDRSLGQHVMMSPQWDLKARTVTSIHMEGSGKDCGSRERHRVTAEGGFQLVELRLRDTCDGKAIGVENFPVVFRVP